jgi:hypothetical protein
MAPLPKAKIILGSEYQPDKVELTTELPINIDIDDISISIKKFDNGKIRVLVDKPIPLNNRTKFIEYENAYEVEILPKSKKVK